MNKTPPPAGFLFTKTFQFLVAKRKLFTAITVGRETTAICKHGQTHRRNGAGTKAAEGLAPAVPPLAVLHCGLLEGAITTS